MKTKEWVLVISVVVVVAVIASLITSNFTGNVTSKIITTEQSSSGMETVKEIMVGPLGEEIKIYGEAQTKLNRKAFTTFPMTGNFVENFVGKVMPIIENDGYCEFSGGCRIWLQMNYMDPHNSDKDYGYVKGPYQMIKDGSHTWRMTIDGKSVSAKDGDNSKKTLLQVSDCVLTDAETSINSKNGMQDTGIGLGLINLMGGSDSDESTYCTLYIED